MASKPACAPRLGRPPNSARKNTDKHQPQLQITGGKFQYMFNGPVGVVNITTTTAPAAAAAAVPMDVDPQSAAAGPASANSTHKEDEAEDDDDAGESLVSFFFPLICVQVCIRFFTRPRPAPSCCGQEDGGPRG